MRVNMHDATTNLTRPVASVESGESDEIELARAGHVVVRIVPVRVRTARSPGTWSGAGPDGPRRRRARRGGGRGVPRRGPARVLLDTRILWWWLAADPSLPAVAEDTITDPDLDVPVSAATAWEIAVNRSAGHLEAPDDLRGTLGENDFGTFGISAARARAAGGLPDDHGDPFDRLLIAQVRVEGLNVVIVDPRFADYDVDLLALG